MNNYKSLIKNRPSSTNLNVALCSSNQIVHYISNKRAVSGIYEFMSDDFKKEFYPEFLANQTLYLDFPAIHCSRARDVFSMVGVKQVDGFYSIDIWVLDVEGAELDVLHSTDFSEVNVKYICMECDGM